MAEECLLCRGAAGDADLFRTEVWADDRWRLTTAISGDPAPGFSYLEPRRHISDVTALDGAEAASFGGVLAHCARIAKEAPMPNSPTFTSSAAGLRTCTCIWRHTERETRGTTYSSRGRPQPIRCHQAQRCRLARTTLPCPTKTCTKPQVRSGTAWPPTRQPRRIPDPRPLGADSTFRRAGRRFSCRSSTEIAAPAGGYCTRAEGQRCYVRPWLKSAAP